MLMKIAEKAGTALAPIILKAAIEQVGGFGPYDADQLIRMIGLKDTRLEDGFGKLDAQLRKIGAAVSAIDERTMFARYNKASSKIGSMVDTYVDARKAAEAPAPDSPAGRQLLAACRALLAPGGATSQAKNMIAALTAPNQPTGRSMLEEYAAHVDHELFGYCALMENLVLSLELALTTAATFRELALNDLEAMGTQPAKAAIEAAEPALSPEDLARVAAHAEPLLARPRAIRDMFRKSAETKTKLRFFHPASGHYLTVTEKGDPLSKDGPFRSPYRYSIDKPQAVIDSVGMPQIFLYRDLTGETVTQPVEYIGTTSPPPLFIAFEVHNNKFDIVLERGNQEWKTVARKEGDGREAVLLENETAKRALDGINRGRVYAGEPGDHGNKYMWWQPMLVMKKPTDEMPVSFESRTVMLRHFISGLALDGDGERVYAEERTPDAGNRHMRWIVQHPTSSPARGDHLNPGDYLLPGEELVFHGGRRTLRYLADGNAELHEKGRQELVWKVDVQKAGAHRLVIGEDGAFTLYTGEGKPFASPLPKLTAT